MCSQMTMSGIHKQHQRVSMRNFCVLISLILFETHSATPSVRSVVSDLTSSLPGVLAGCGAAGECLSETGAVVAVVAPGVVEVSLVGSSAGAGEG